MPSDRKDGTVDGLNPAVVRQIDENLKLMYRKHLEDALPDKLKTLVDQLRAQARRD
ncbi:regulator [Rhodobacteraceae bacterium 2376]|uniref:Regulator n=1 Tax=Rhabdonatronobacter sediminivivens TaxID=2743469 RepID=A0A7Z0L121_9RHOB|nr:NepR family anti-sigma factor [Rhabdonatronobacter sediminivivens]NYS26541.1 regulator [Rhabdonatronobacter sediminivivens]